MVEYSKVNCKLTNVQLNKLRLLRNKSIKITIYIKIRH